MFSNIGGKIKGFAAFICAIGIFCSIVAGVMIMLADESAIALGLIIAVVGSLISWLGSFFSYGFGQLIENSDKLVKMVETQNKRPVYSDNTETTVRLISYNGYNKINVINEIRKITGCSLVDAKVFVEKVPQVVKKCETREEAEELMERLVQAGATADIKDDTI